MTDARILLAFLAIVSVSFLYISIGVKSALAPLCAVATAGLWFTVFGMLGFLWAGGLAFYVLAALGGVCLIWRRVIKKRTTPSITVAMGQLSIGFWFFIVAALVCIVLLWVKQPMFITWDEFSLWGTAGKLSKLYNQMYTTAPVGWAWTASQTPLLMMLNYFVQFFGRGFSEWQTYAAADILLLAGMAAVLGVFEKRRWPAAVGAALVLLLVPFVFMHGRNVVGFSPAYLDSLGDVPLGIAFGGAIAAWYAGVKEADVNTKRGSAAQMLPLCLALAALSLIKDMVGLVLALVVALLVCIDYWRAPLQEGKALRKNAKGALARLGISGLASILPYFLWKFVYLSGAAGVNALSGSGGKLNMGLHQYPIAFISDLFSPNKSELFKTVTGGMARNFVTLRGTLLGSGAMIMAGVAVLLVLACIVAKTKQHRRRCITYGVVSTLGMVLYTLLITMTYLYMMRAEQAMELISYERYMLPYYIGWFMGALVLLGQSLAAASVKRAALGSGVLLVLGLLLLVRVGQVAPIGSTIVGVHRQDYNFRHQYSQYVQNLRGQLDEKGKTFIVLSDDDGFKWFVYCYEMLPWQVDYSFGGGQLVERTLQTDGTTLIHEVTCEELSRHLIDTGCTTLYIDNADENFVNLYSQLFSDDMSGYLDDGLRLYNVTESNGNVILTPADDFEDQN